MNGLTIGQLAQAGEIGVETIRFYERRGLLPKPPRTDSGYRQFPPESVEQVRFIRNAKELGFTLREIAELLSLRIGPEASCAAVKEKAELKIAEVRRRIRELQKIEAALVKLTSRCRRGAPAADCHFLEVLTSP